MAGGLTLAAKILGGFHDARAEDLLPEAIDRHTRRQRMPRSNEPLGKAQPISRSIRRQRRQKSRRIAAYFRTVLIVLASFKDVGRTRLLAFLEDQRSRDRQVELGA